jgi:hypothetical protein
VTLRVRKMLFDLLRSPNLDRFQLIEPLRCEVLDGRSSEAGRGE